MNSIDKPNAVIQRCPIQLMTKKYQNNVNNDDINC